MYVRDINKIMKQYINELGKVEAIRKHFPFSEATFYDMTKGRYNWTNRKALKVKEDLRNWIDEMKEELEKKSGLK